MVIHNFLTYDNTFYHSKTAIGKMSNIAEKIYLDIIKNTFAKLGQ